MAADTDANRSAQVAPLFEACTTELADRTKLLAFLSVFSSDSSYRQRVVYTQCALACVRAQIDRATFENAWLPTLTGLARDRVVGVRIAVARVIGEACKTRESLSQVFRR